MRACRLTSHSSQRVLPSDCPANRCSGCVLNATSDCYIRHDEGTSKARWHCVVNGNTPAWSDGDGTEWEEDWSSAHGRRAWRTRDRLLVPFPLSIVPSSRTTKSTKIQELMCLNFEKRFDLVSTYVYISHPHNLLFPALIKCRFTGVIALPSNNAPKVFL